MPGFYANRLKIFSEVETEPDAVATPAADQQEGEPAPQPQDNNQPEQQNPDANQEPETQDNSGGDPQQQDADGAPPQDNPAPDMPAANEPVGDSGNPPAEGGNPPPEGEAEVDPIKKKEEEIYADLTPEQLDIKHRELKDQFLAMYDASTEIISRINNLTVDSEDISAIEYASNKLSELRDMMTDYISHVYKTKSYTENSINYNRFLATLHGINKILEEISKNDD